MLKYKMKCPKCRKRVFDIGGIMQEVPIVLELKCPHCKSIVRIVCSGKDNN